MDGRLKAQAPTAASPRSAGSSVEVSFLQRLRMGSPGHNPNSAARSCRAQVGGRGDCEVVGTAAASQLHEALQYLRPVLLLFGAAYGDDPAT